MKCIRPLVCSLLALLLTLLVAAALADTVDTVTVTVNIVDSVTGEPLNKQLYMRHAQCIYWNRHDLENCTCYGTNTGIRAHKGLTPCDCGEIWADYDQVTPYHSTSTGTFTLKTGHKYLLFMEYMYAGYNEYHLRQWPAAYIYADPDTGEVSYVKNGINLSQTGDTTFQIALVTRLTPVDVHINATKLLDGKDPGEKKFAFKLWKLTLDQIDAFQPDNFLTDEDFPEWKEEYENMTEEEYLEMLISEGIFALAHSRMMAALEELPYTIVYNDGKNIPILNESFTAYDFPDERVYPLNYVITEVCEEGNGVCEDNIIYAIGSSVSPFYITYPILEDDMIPSDDREPPFDAPVPIEWRIERILGFSPRGEFFQYFEGEKTSKEMLAMMVFRNTTCPNADPTATPVPTPAVPATGDGTSLLLLAAAALMALTLARRLRRA